MSRGILISAALCAALAACGGSDGSGVSGGKTLLTLEDDEIADLCEYITDVAGPARTIMCPGGLTITFGGLTVSECITTFEETQVDAPNCTATVSNTESCIEGLADLSDAQWCSDSTPPPTGCQALLSCGEIL